MNRQDFILKGMLGTGIFAASSASAALLKNDIDEIKPLDIVGFNHLPTSSEKLDKNRVLHTAASRGGADHGWLNTKHSFSFASWYNPERMHFGALRVLNDDIVTGGGGFPTHPHDNMEIISIPLSGDLEHKDSMGNVSVIKQYDVQVMSAGSGIEHSEYNRNRDKTVNFLQIWLYPSKANVKPRYDQITLDPKGRMNQLQQILSPDPNDAGVWIHQRAWFSMGKYNKSNKTNYDVRAKGNGVYAFVLDGTFEVAGQTLNRRDALGIWDVNQLEIITKTPGEILIMDVPMSI